MDMNKFLPSGKDDWQLYDMKGAGRAAVTLKSGLRKALKRIEKLVKEGNSITHSAVLGQSDMHNIQVKVAKFGASDSEPNAVVRDAILKFCAERWGIDTDKVRRELW